MSFIEVFDSWSWEKTQERIYSTTESQVERVLRTSGPKTPEDFLALVSPAAGVFVKHMEQLSRAITEKRFGKTIQMYIPLYLSNECQNICTYCGFSLGNKIERLTLSEDQIGAEVRAIKALGYDHVLLVSGEANKTVGLQYFMRALETIRPFFSQISMEVQPLSEEEYRALSSAGTHAVLVYQETYHREAYRTYHPRGKKSNFNYRLETPDRLGRAGIHKIGLGTLIGLEDWRTDACFVALHLRYLERRYWKTKCSVSFPRLRPAEGALSPKDSMNDAELLQLICAYRIYNENVELSLSTRETASFRDRLVGAGITSMSAGSKTEPGGYALGKGALRQFEIGDDRSPLEVATMIRSRGFEPVWKDWERGW